MPETLPEELSNTPLTLENAFATIQDWEETRFEVADRSDVQGMGVEVRGCQEQSGAQIEFRLANRFESLTFSVGQGNLSRDADQNLAVRVLGNEDQLDIQLVPFNEIRPFAVDVRGVNSLKIRLFLDDAEDQCQSASRVIAVIQDVRVK